MRRASSIIHAEGEAEFLAKANLGPRIYNLFDPGGYLLWRLYPKYRVMTDSRSFPYLSWFDDQYRFSMGDSFEEFLQRYPADVAVIDIVHVATWRHFLKSPDWRPVFYGPTSAVFLKNTVSYDQPLTASVSNLRNAATALRLFRFEAELGDMPAAWTTLDYVESALSHQADRAELTDARAYRDGYRALKAGDWPRARSLFDEAFRDSEPGERDSTIRKYLVALAAASATGSKEKIEASRAALAQFVR